MKRDSSLVTERPAGQTIYGLKPHRLFLLCLFSLLIFCCVTRLEYPQPEFLPTFRHYFSSNDVRITYYELGQGDPIIFLHGFGGASYLWRHVYPSFQKDHRIFLIDLKGFGLSDRPRDGRYSVNDQAEIIKSFILQKNLENITIVGHSLGGAVALFTYFKVNPRIKALVLLNCATYPESMPRFLKVLRIPIINNFFSALIPTRLAVKKILKKSFYNDAKITEELVSAYTFYSSLPGSGYVSRRTAEQIVPDNIFELLQRLREITAPVFLLWGYDDEVIPLAYGLKLLHAIPGSRLVSLRQCGHIPPEEKPSDTVAEMGRFLESLPKNAGAVGQQPW